MKPEQTSEKSESGLAFLIKDALDSALNAQPFAACELPRTHVCVGPAHDPKFGDVSISCFELAEKLGYGKKGASVVAQQLAAAFPRSPRISAVSPVGPYVNIFLNREAVSPQIVSMVLSEGERYGCNRLFAGKTFMVEYLSPNTNKPLHLGHLRNGVIGTTAARLLEACGAKVLKANNINDRGIHIVKSMLAYERFGNGETPESSGEKGDHFVGRYYVRFETELRRLRAEWFRENGIDRDALPEEEREKADGRFESECSLMNEAREMLRRWESGDQEILPLWRRMNQWVLSGFDQTNARLGYLFDRVYYESRTYLLGRDIVREGLSRGVGERRSDQAIVVNLDDAGLGTKLLLRSDGTSVYMTQDLGLAVTRFKEEGKLDGIIYVVATEQERHFKVLFELLKRYGYEWASSLYHLSYGMVNLPSGRMKSREGTVVDADNLLDGLESAAWQKLCRAGGLSGEEAQRSAAIIAIGALNYYLAAVTPRFDMLFDPNSSIEFEGNTGPYIQYSCVRIASIVNKVERTTAILTRDPGDLTDDPAFPLVKALAEFPAAVRRAAQQFNPAVLTGALYETARAFSSFYRDRQVLRDGMMHEQRLELCKATRTVLQNGLRLLGIGVPDRM